MTKDNIPATESIDYVPLSLSPSPSYSSLEASGSVASPFHKKAKTGPNSSAMSRPVLDGDYPSIAGRPQTKSFRSRRPVAIDTSWDTTSTSTSTTDEPSSFHQPSTPKNSAQSGHFFGPSPRSVLDTESTKRVF
jgi:hypothetical protein